MSNSGKLRCLELADTPDGFELAEIHRQRFVLRDASVTGLEESEGRTPRREGKLGQNIRWPHFPRCLI